MLPILKTLKCKVGIHTYGPVKQLVLDGRVIFGYRCGVCGQIKELIK